MGVFDTLYCTGQWSVYPKVCVCLLQKVPEEKDCWKVKDYTPDGTCNNIMHPTWGAAFTRLERLLPQRYENQVGPLFRENWVYSSFSF